MGVKGTMKGMRSMCWPLISILLVCSCSSKPAQPSIYIDPAFIPLMPADTTAAIGFRVETLKKTPAWGRILSSQAARLEEFRNETSFDLQQDLRELVVVWNGTEALVMARGKFSPMGLEPKLDRKGAQRLHHKGYPILGDEETAVLFVNTTTAVAGRTATLRGIIDARDGSKGSVSPALLDRARSIGHQNQVWAVMLAPNLPADMIGGNLGANLTRLTNGVEVAWMGADFSSGIHAVTTVLCRGDQQAGQLNDALRGIVGIARFAAGSGQPDLLRIYDSIGIARNERVVKIDLNVPLDLVEKTLGLITSLRG